MKHSQLGLISFKIFYFYLNPTRSSARSGMIVSDQSYCDPPVEQHEVCHKPGFVSPAL